MWTISCHCGATAQSLRPRETAEEGISLCHCDVCRHTTGALCTSYLPIQGPPDRLDRTTSYRPGDGRVWLFCAGCGCHVFRRRDISEGDGEWEVATGVMTAGDDEEPARFFDRHAGLADTKDGGLSRWLRFGSHTTREPVPASTPADEPLLRAGCHCRGVTFSISRPSPGSRAPTSGFPDLMLPFARTDPDIIANPGDDKWWLRDGDTRFLAGACACASCRATLGFETQAWAFVPRANITWAPSGEAENQPENEPENETLDFDGLHRRGVLKGYASSDGVVRESCPRCGATVFWRDRWRPGVVDVSVGLLRAGEGALAEGWLHWWTGRVSFAEDVGLGRTGAPAARAERLIAQLGEGMGGLKGG